MNNLFASTLFGCEDLLEKELIDLGVQNISVIKGGVYYTADDLILYKTLMWSRIASRIFLCIKKFSIQEKNHLYIYTYTIAWNNIFNNTKTFLIHFQGTNNIIRNSFFGALIVKDAILDYFDKNQCDRPNVNLINPDIRIKVILYDNIINIMLDLSGPSLHKRGYRNISTNLAPIKENLGMAIVLRSGWNKKHVLIDPMCGSGTLLIEAAMMYSNRAPGLERKKWGFYAWKKYNTTLWNMICKEAIKKFNEKIVTQSQNFIGYDYDINAIEEAKNNALKAGVLKIIHFETCNLQNINNSFFQKKIGVLLSNPPYGKRYQTENQLIGIYVYLNIIAKKYFKNWYLSIFTSSKYLLNFIQMQYYEKFFFKNGPLNCIQKNYQIFSKHSDKINNEYQNRLYKNFKILKKWAKKEKIECFRVYDADLPNYNIIVDIYKNWIIIQEYQRPKEIKYYHSHNRLCHAIYYTIEMLSIPINNIILKFRKPQKGNQQYQKLFNSNSFIVIQEYNFKFLVNLIDYLDTGLFLEKRLIRKLLNNISQDKHFLNLFAYTGTATVAAGLGGAKSTTTVDISNTYIKWAMRNMSINNLNNNKHNFIQADCLDWLKHNHKKFDLIFINPPTFSNSKRMKKIFDLQKDYLNLMIDLKKNLSCNGKIIFSSSTHNFNLNFNELKNIRLKAKNITKSIKSKDSLNNSNTYHSWMIKHI